MMAMSEAYEQMVNELDRTPMEQLQGHAQAVVDEIDKWGNASEVHIYALIQVAGIALESIGQE